MPLLNDTPNSFISIFVRKSLFAFKYPSGIFGLTSTRC